MHAALRKLALAALLAPLVADTAFAAEPNLAPGRPNIWGVWLGTGGYPDVDPRYRNTPWPQLEFTPWGAAESQRLNTPETPDECMPYGPIGYMGGAGLFPLDCTSSSASGSWVVGSIWRMRSRSVI